MLKPVVTKEKEERLAVRRSEAGFNPSNIDAQGNVLYLDEERLKRKEQPEKPIYKKHPKGLGISDFLIRHVTAARDWDWKFVLFEFKALVAGSKAFFHRENWIGYLWSKLMRFERDNKSYTHGTVLPLNVDVSDQAETTVLPIDLVKDIINKAEFIASMNTCICRDASNCKDYPKEVCCLVFSKMARVLIKNGTAYEISKEQALQRVDEAAKLGLFAQAMFIEIEQLIWGLTNDEMDGFFEICFCCPCCCVAQNVLRFGNERVKSRWNPSGWTMVADQSKCIGCGKCVTRCASSAIRIKDGKVQINQELCTGCGICKTMCPTGDVLKLKQTMPMRASIDEYFVKEGRLQLDYYGDGLNS